MKDIIKEMGLDDKTFPAKYVLSIISQEKDKMVSADEMLERAESGTDYKDLHVARAYKRYQTRLKENNALDFDDIILQTVLLLQNNVDNIIYHAYYFVKWENVVSFLKNKY